jgi:formylglycine-generating enzyme required for sulfatase activity
MKKITLFLFSLVTSVMVIKANNVAVNNATLTGQVTASQYTIVQFDVSWENSWRLSAGPKNWDAVWVFIKYQVFGQEWKHATLSTNSTHHSVATDNGIAATITPATDGKGVMMYRTNTGTGNINWQSVRLRWNYGTDAVGNTDQVTIKVFAIEMVDIPQGPFFIGDGTVGNNSFRDGLGYPFRISGETAITFQATSGSSVSQPADPNWSGGYTLASAYPKGFQEFYVMKYEITQAQFMEFFNTLPNNKVLKDNKNITGISYRNSLTWSGLANDGMASGGDRACNGLNYSDLCAYADWSAMRPMTELEYEKASRGCDNTGTPTPIFPVANEYAWGNTTISNGTSSNTYSWRGLARVYNTSCGTVSFLSNDGTSSENLAGGCNTNSNCSQLTQGLGNAPINCNIGISYSDDGTFSGPVRVGIFAAKNCGSLQRERSGASYYGVMELSGNVAEILIQTKRNINSTSSSNQFSGTHGDGTLSSAGYATNTDWYDNANGTVDVVPGLAGQPCGLRGGSFQESSNTARTSDRSSIGTSSTPSNCDVRSIRNGGRLVRIP